MCGIGGILRITPPGEKHEPIPDEWLDLLDEGIAWRGPDGSGRFRDTVTKPDGTIIEVALVHRRLAIIDLEGGAQPMVSTHGRTRDDGTREGLVAVVFNGCIYNHHELRAELEAKGHKFVTDHSDTEVLIHGWREWGQRLIEHLDGMYAIVLWDATQTRLFAFRDRFGEKPLWGGWSLYPNAFVVASTASAISAIAKLFKIPEDAPEYSGSRLAISRDAAADWLCLGFGIGGPLIVHHEVQPSTGIAMPSRPEARWNKTKQLTAGLLTAIADSASCGLFSHSMRSMKPARRSPKLTIELLESLLENAVCSRLESDVPLGCFLSGGVDSSIISLFARRQIESLTTLTVRMPDESTDESHHARRVADLLGTHHIEVACDPTTASDDLVSLIRMLGAPLGDSSLLPTYWLCRAAREHVKVALSGDGGDELFYGYDRYRGGRALSYGRSIIGALPLSLFDQRDPKSAASRLARLCAASRGHGYIDLLNIFPSTDRRKLIGRSRGFLCRMERYDYSRALGESMQLAGIPHGLSHPDWRAFDVVTYLPCDLLRKVDTASLGAGIEVRCPMLDPQLADCAIHTSARHHMRRGETKHLLKELARKHLPPSIINRPKQGFAIPLSDWWRSDFGNLRTLMLDHLTSTDPFPGLEALNINMDYVRQMIDEHMAAGPAGSARPIPQLSTRIKHIRPRDHAQRLYMLTVLSIWARWLQGIRNSPQSTQSTQRSQSK